MRTKIDALMDSVYAIDQTLLNNDNQEAKSIIRTLKANKGHIQLCIGKEEYMLQLTEAQLAELNRVVTAATEKINTLNEQVPDENGQ